MSKKPRKSKFVKLSRLYAPTALRKRWRDELARQRAPRGRNFEEHLADYIQHLISRELAEGMRRFFRRQYGTKKRGTR